MKQDFIIFEDLFQTYRHSLLLFAYKYVNDKQAAEDIVQDVFIALWIRRDEIDFSQPIKPYLYKATYHKSLTYLSSLKNSLNIDEKDTRMLIHQKIVSYNQPDSLLLQEIEQEIITFANMLPPQCKTVFQLSRGANLKNREIAERLNISEKTVEGHIRKALFGLRNHLIAKKIIECFLIFI